MIGVYAGRGARYCEEPGRGEWEGSLEELLIGGDH